MIILVATVMTISSVTVIMYVNYFTAKNTREIKQLRSRDNFKKSTQIIIQQEEAGKGVLEDE